MAFVIPRYGRWLPCYRHSAWWLGAALLCALVVGYSERASESVGPLAVIPLGLLTIVWAGVMVLSSLWSAWQSRRDARVVWACLIAPFVSVALFALTLAAVWWTWGVLPFPVDKTTDFQIDKILPSPDGAWQAVYDEDLSGGPATGVSEDVYLVRQHPGAALFYKDRVFSIECIQNLQMRWIGPRTLEVGYIVGDQTPTAGLQPQKHLPLFHHWQDEWFFNDPVKVIERRRVVHGNLC